MQHIDEQYLYKDEKIIKEISFSKVPIIVLFIVAVIASIILIAIGATHNFIYIALGISIGWLTSCFIYTFRYFSRELVITNRRIIFKSGVMIVSHLDIPLNKIQMVNCTQTFWQRYFKYGTVVISNSVYGIIGHRFNGIDKQ